MSSIIPATSTLTLAGIDVSHHQGEVNWYAVAEAGISFAFAKATEGATFVDPQFSRNWASMKDAGIVRGAYHFFRPAKPVESQVSNFLKAVNELGDGDLPAVLDLEEAPTPHGDEWEDVPGQNRVPLVLTWLDAVANRLGRKPIIYTRRGFIELELPEPAALAQSPLWVAHYTARAAPQLPSIWSNWTFWQYSEGGKVDGVEGHVDLNRFNGTAAELSGLAGIKTYNNMKLGTRRFDLDSSAHSRRFIISEGYDPKVGCRALLHSINAHIRRPLAALLDSGQIPRGCRVEVVVDSSAGKLSFIRLG